MEDFISDPDEDEAGLLREYRLAALRLAHNPALKGDEVLALATKYLAFITDAKEEEWNFK